MITRGRPTGRQRLRLDVWSSAFSFEANLENYIPVEDDMEDLMANMPGDGAIHAGLCSSLARLPSDSLS